MRRHEMVDDVIDVEVREIPQSEAPPIVPLPSLIRTPHPMSLDGQQVLDVREAPLYPGESLQVFLARHEVLPAQQWIVSVGGVAVPEAMWSRVRPKVGQLIEARRVPGRSALLVVASLALAYFTVGAGGLGAGGLFAEGGTFAVAGKLGAGLAFLGGSFLINKLLAPRPPAQQQNQAQPTTYGVSGGRNNARLWQPMGLVLGEPHCVPDLGAQPYVFFEGEHQYLWQVFNIGFNCAALEALKLGDTDLASYEGVSISRDGMLEGNTGLPGLAASVDTIAGGQLESPESSNPSAKLPGAWVTRTTSPDTVRIAVDIEAQLTAMSDTGGYLPMYASIDLEYRSTAANSNWNRWYPNEVVLGNTGTKPVRRTFVIGVPLGQYEVRVRKAIATPNQSTMTSVLVFSGMKSYQIDSGDYTGQARLGVQIKASGQLNGSLDTVNMRARARPMPVWLDWQWKQATRRDNGLSNPGALILLLARGIHANGRRVAGLGLPDSQIDIESLKGFMTFCFQRDLKFDHYLQDSMSIEELLDLIAAAGLGSISWHSGRLGVIWFSDDQPIEGVLNMGTIKANSFSVTYDTMQTADELEYQYFDRDRGNAWQSLRVLAPGVETPAQTARVQATGVCSERQAGVLARFAMAQNVYQRKTVTCEVDLEHMVFRRGTVLALSHDITQWGYGGRLQHVSRDGESIVLHLDDEVPSAGPSGALSRYVGLRLPGERGYRVFGVQAFEGSSRELRLNGAWPVGVILPGSSEASPAHDTVWIYDFKATPGQKMRVANIQPQGNLEGARVSLVPEEPEFWNYVWNGSYAPPPNNSLLGQDRPIIRNLRISAEQAQQGGGFVTLLTASFEAVGAFASAQLWAAADGNELERIGGDIVSQSVTFEARRGQTWQIEIRPFDSLGRGGGVARASYYVAANEPANVAGLSLVVQDTGVVARWKVPGGAAGIGWASTALRVGPAWATAVQVFEGKADSHNLGWLPAGQTTVWASHRDTAGQSSPPAFARIDIAPPSQPVLGADLDGLTLTLSWEDCRTTQPMREYLVSVGPTLANSVVKGRTAATSFALIGTVGRHTYWVVAVDVAGNGGAAGYREVNVIPGIEEGLKELVEGLPEQVDELKRIQTGFPEQIADLLSIQTGLSDRLMDEADFRATSIRRIENIVTEGDEQLAEAITHLSARTGNAEDEIVKTAASVKEEARARADAVEAEARARRQLDVQVQEARAQIIEESRLRADADESEARERLRLAGKVENAQTLLEEERKARVAANEAEAHQRTLLASVVDKNAGLLQQEMKTRADAGTAEATARLALAGRVGQAEASIVQESTVRADAVGKLQAKWGLQVTAGGKVAGVQLNNDGKKSNFIILADRFAIARDDAGRISFPFIVGTVAGVSTVGIDGSLLVKGTVKAEALEVDKLSAITARLGYVTAGQIDIHHDGTGDWGYIRSAGKWRDGNWGWILARRGDGSTFVDFTLDRCGLVMHHEAGKFANFRMWGPGFDLGNGGLTISQLNVIDTLNVKGSAITVPNATVSGGSSTGVRHDVPSTPEYPGSPPQQAVPTWITASTIMPPWSMGILQIKINGNVHWQGGAVQGACVTGAVKVDLWPGSYWITAENTVAGNTTSIFVLSTRR